MQNLQRPTQVQVADLDGDGRSDVLWRSDTTGDVSGWLMEGLTIRTRSHIRRVEQHWEAIR